MSEPKKKAVTLTVAANRTVVCDDKDLGPGTEFTVGEDEAAALIARGFAIDPTAEPVEPKPLEGASITTDGCGASVRLA